MGKSSGAKKSKDAARASGGSAGRKAAALPPGKAAARGKGPAAGKPAARPAGPRGIVLPGKKDPLSAWLRFVRDVPGLRRKDGPEILGNLLFGALDKNPRREVAIACVDALRRTEQPRAFEILNQALVKSPSHPMIANKVLEAAGAAPHREALLPLETIAAKPGLPMSLRRQAVLQLLKRRTPDSWACVARLLYRATEGREREVSAELIEHLRKSLDSAYPVYVKSLRAKDEEERMYAAHALGMMGERKAIDPLRSAANSTKDRVLREVATKAALMLYLA